MSKPLKMLAFDLGASSGRAILGILDGSKLTIEEIHRFSNDPVEVRGSVYWDILRLYHEIKLGILKCAVNGHREIDSLAIDTWGVDFGLLDENDNLLGNPFHYRDSRTDGMMEEVFKVIQQDELYLKTGIQFMKLNTIFQLLSMKHTGSNQLKEARTMLLTPDLLNFFLTGTKVTEYSIASTTQLLDPEKRIWSKEIIERLGLPSGIFTEIVPSGRIVGKLSPALTKELGVGEIPVIATAGHDTQSAIAVVPAHDDAFLYISSGTWSLMGIETDKPIINEKSFRLAFTNEGGLTGKITFLKNIMGLWLVQECKRNWDKKGEELGFANLEKMAGESKPFVSFIDPDDELFIALGDMPQRIKEFCRRTGQTVPETKGDIIRCIMQSLAMKYRMTAESIEEITGKKYPVIHMIGGGVKNKMLCQFTANAAAREVIAGPVEATSIGNLMIQALANGGVKNLKEIRSVVRNSFPTTVYQPQETDLWNNAYSRYKVVIDAHM